MIHLIAIEGNARRNLTLTALIRNHIGTAVLVDTRKTAVCITQVDTDHSALFLGHDGRPPSIAMLGRHEKKTRPRVVPRARSTYVHYVSYSVRRRTARGSGNSGGSLRLRSSPASSKSV